jgi:KDO2-lipid IV(A) lauroyltransferase
VIRPPEISVPRTRHDAVDRRLGGAWTPAQTVKNWLIAAALRALVRGLDRVPARALLRAGRAAGRFAAWIPGARRAARNAVQRCFGHEEARSIARRCFASAGESAATSLLLRRPGVRASDWVAVPEESARVLSQVLSRGRGAIFVSAHLGPFELVAARIAELGIPAAIVVRESYDPRLDAVVDAHRIAHGLDVIHRGHTGAGIRIVRALRAGKPVGFLPDLGGRVPSLTVDFLGRPTPFPVGPQHLAQRLDVPLVVGTLYRNAAGAPFSLRIVEVPTNTGLDDLTRRVACRLDEAIRATPTDFLWMAREN